MSEQGTAAQSVRSAQDRALAAPDLAAWVSVGESWLRLARVHSQPRYVQHADDCAARALAQEPDSPAASRLRGLALLDAHEFRRASKLARALLTRNPDDVQSWSILSDAELELGNLAAATDAAQQMLDRKPGLLSYGRAAHLRWLGGDRDGSKLLYAAAIRAGGAAGDPEPQAWMLTQAAWVFWHDGDYAGARAGFSQALTAVPDYVPAWQGLGRVALSTGEHSAAIAYFERAQARQPQAEVAWWLGDALTASGQHDRARSAYAEVERLAARADPRTLALFCATRGRHLARAVALARRAFHARPDVYSKDVLAFALYRDGQLEESKRLARELIATGTVDARVVYHAGLILRATGDQAEGASLMTRALAQNPRFDLRLTGVIDDES